MMSKFRQSLQRCLQLFRQRMILRYENLMGIVKTHTAPLHGRRAAHPEGPCGRSEVNSAMFAITFD